MMDRFRSIQVFVKVAKRGGFASAARELAMSPPAVTRAVSDLEDRIGTRLFVRTTRSVRLTESGERFLQDCRRILVDMEEAEEAAVGSHAAPRGELRVTAPVLFGRLFVTPILGDFLDRYPLVACRTLFVDRIVNLMDEGLDVAIRIGNLPDSSLTAIRVGSVRNVLCASREYLGDNSRPNHPSDLTDHDLIDFVNLTTAGKWNFGDGRKSIAYEPTSRLRVNSAEVAIEAVKNSHGITRVLSYMIATELRSGELEIVLEDFESPPVPVHIVHKEARQTSARVRAVVDYLVQGLRKHPAIS